MKTLFIVPLFLFANAVFSAEVYKWKDENGRWHFGSSSQGSGNADVSTKKVKPNGSGLSSCKGDCSEANKMALQNEKEMLADRGECAKLYYMFDSKGKEAAKRAKEECLTNKAAERLKMENAKVGTQQQDELRNSSRDYEDRVKANNLNNKIDEINRKLDRQRFGY